MNTHVKSPTSECEASCTAIKEHVDKICRLDHSSVPKLACRSVSLCQPNKHGLRGNIEGRHKDPFAFVLCLGLSNILGINNLISSRCGVVEGFILQWVVICNLSPLTIRALEDSHLRAA